VENGDYLLFGFTVVMDEILTDIKGSDPSLVYCRIKSLGRASNNIMKV